MSVNTPNRTVDDFGSNEWLVEELYEQYKSDKNSVDQSWWPFFDKYEKNGDGAAAKTADAEPAAKTGTKPAAKSNVKSASKAPAKPADKSAKDTSGADSVADDSPRGISPSSAQSETLKAETKSVPKVVVKDTEPKPTPEETVTPLRGPAKLIAKNMDDSIEVPTATSVRALPAKALIDNRIVINSHLKRTRGGKVSFTHLIGFAVIRALQNFPSQNVSYDVRDGKPVMVSPAHVNFGLAIDVPKKDGSRTLLVPNVKKAETLTFRQFVDAYDGLVDKARQGKLTADDFAGTSVSLTNPGGIGTVHSVPRLTKGQGCIIGVGALDYPAEFQGASQHTINKLAVSKVLTLTSTYDHRVIQGAGSGEFLKLVHSYLLGEDGFYDDVFESLRLPYEPVRWVPDVSAEDQDDVNKTARVIELIDAYRTRGHLMANIDPLVYRQRSHPDLDINQHGLTLWDLEREFPTGGFGAKPMMPFRNILGLLRESYCRTIGFEYMHIADPLQRRWFQAKIEVPHQELTRSEQGHILGRLNAAEAFETFLQTKYIGQKRFSLEGGESAIVLLDEVLNQSADTGMEQVAIGMAHRGRLNVLTNIAGKSYAQMFREFDGTMSPDSVQGSGDVKYHLGTEGSFTSPAGNSTDVYVAANPSHLETVDPILEGIVRAKQDFIDQGEAGFTVLPVLVHGDAAFAGQGVVTETLNLSELRGYRTGGTIHIIINNQVGFTTPPASARSSFYCTDVAKSINAPIFHVNGDDPEAVVRAARLAFEYRQEFNRDVIIDLVCYRRRGHNEGDDPSMTQPLMYSLIEKKGSVRKLYTESLVGRKCITDEEASEALKDYQSKLESAFAETKEAETGPYDGDAFNAPHVPSDIEAFNNAETAISTETLHHIGETFAAVPENFTIHKKLRALLEKRKEMSLSGGIDWGFAELLAFGSLLMDGIPVRLAGQDSRRGTFVQRHSVLIDAVNGNEWTPLQNLSDEQARFWVYDSLLSEYAAVGFEYGYSVERKDALVAWEAQFGDFAQGAQSVIDEFISSSEQKWQQNSGVVMLLPHGYEGQGPDHSSARIERYLQLCAESNMTVALPSSGASYFHLLRRHAMTTNKRPLIVFTPKSMLRLKAAANSPEDFTSGTFEAVIDDAVVDPEKVDRVVMVSGKLYWELLAQREKREDTKTALVRVEQLYPLDEDSITALLDRYPDSAELVWAQEEPENQGAWPFMALNMPQLLGDREITVISRPASAATATGLKHVHEVQQQEVIDRIFRR
ncbi:multifunctional oxoglutarate decarboxylase/oxoglutarate dehydrogenase thiamine pyrophosphate-binding subunit/dihydrolipoyllysine-residue succinyltransferase subunit [Brevibacterium sp. UCMA 11752]|uniref:multifunctional oxoglutarate decarboxylase/oxoglutarate dehydrogenase thiamine pyrophosphate-binding subunit/dihydrolipoyllysine-residue succinyltransferase subunit n=1 Tax=Brevibacterium sp. UCMA 11752 TaxID=2745946 RepID=UPI001F1D16AC|nr:multifunctional oxoglutarate decarboxylase/oxoglutarate dehydrogenase thiamine pyrophosphate-binding subunit/dihydrolipoyllysine-residue succinyltransferase subunit [Brevibacterium sp. UCMA 11752]MCF2588363.1 multifunctional oxoglutarate decarboxylase/oxoglutarate dehydrogenase thiamine pyrophosphate-binding subunit/dihydrolipoyllysine-residue succinyltransferase subunit [Brevibacterium sp. UCMA 11752]